MNEATRTEPPSLVPAASLPAVAVLADDPEEPPSSGPLKSVPTLALNPAAALALNPAAALNQNPVATLTLGAVPPLNAAASSRTARKSSLRSRQADWTRPNGTVQAFDPAALKKRSTSSTGPATGRPKARRLALVCNMKPVEVEGAPQGPEDEFEEFDSPATIQALVALLSGEGYVVSVLEADRTLAKRLSGGNFDLVFNIAEGKGGRCREALVPALCELLGIAYTGSDPLTLAATLDKAVAKRLVSPEVRTPRWLLVRSMADLPGNCPNRQSKFDMRFPLFAKPNDEGSSKGIRDDSRCENLASLEALCARLLDTYGRPVLVEEFVGGAEVTVGVVGNREPEVIGMMHVVPTEGRVEDFVYSLEVKRDWQNRVRYAIPPELPPETCKRIEAAALTAFRMLDCRDVARIDFRLDQDGEPCFIEANPLPGLSPTSGDLVLMAKAMGWTWEGLISRIVREAEFRQGVLRPTLVPRLDTRRKGAQRQVWPASQGTLAMVTAEANHGRAPASADCVP